MLWHDTNRENSPRAPTESRGSEGSDHRAVSVGMNAIEDLSLITARDQLYRFRLPETE